MPKTTVETMVSWNKAFKSSDNELFQTKIGSLVEWLANSYLLMELFSDLQNKRIIWVLTIRTRPEKWTFSPIEEISDVLCFIADTNLQIIFSWTILSRFCFGILIFSPDYETRWLKHFERILFFLSLTFFFAVKRKKGKKPRKMHNIYT